MQYDRRCTAPSTVPASPQAKHRPGQWLGRAPDAPEPSDNGPTINVIHQVWRARQLRPAWSASLASVVAWTACLHRDLTIDRDHDAGGSWITLLRDRTPLGHLGADLPLLMCTRTLARENWPFPLVVIGLPDLNRPVMRCEPAVLEDCFDRAISAKSLDPEAFSAADLWFCTI